MYQPFFFDRNSLKARARDRHSAYVAARPFPHAVLDDFLPEDVAQRLADAFPKPNFEGYREPTNSYQVRKLGRLQESNFEGVDPAIRSFLQELNSLAFLEFLEELTGISGLIPDPHYTGGALHQILRGGRLDIHADFNFDHRRKLYRRVNVLLYFNPGWREEWGGHLELWDQDMKRCESRVAPIFNRCVVFSTSSRSYHGHPEPLACPEGVTRNSIALYYYTAEPCEIDGPRRYSTLWQLRPGEKADGGRKSHKPPRAYPLEQWVPPVLLRAWKRWRRASA